MVKYKLVVSDPKTGKAESVELDEAQSAVFLGRRIGDIIDASVIGKPGYVLKITGGSDTSGFPMLKSIRGTVKKPVLLSKGPGLRKVKRKGYRKRKTVRGDTIAPDIYQVNVVLLKKEELEA